MMSLDFLGLQPNPAPLNISDAGADSKSLILPKSESPSPENFDLMLAMMSGVSAQPMSSLPDLIQVSPQAETIPDPQVARSKLNDLSQPKDLFQLNESSKLLINPMRLSQTPIDLDQAILNPASASLVLPVGMETTQIQDMLLNPLHADDDSAAFLESNGIDLSDLKVRTSAQNNALVKNAKMNLSTTDFMQLRDSGSSWGSHGLKADLVHQQNQSLLGAAHPETLISDLQKNDLLTQSQKMNVEFFDDRLVTAPSSAKFASNETMIEIPTENRSTGTARINPENLRRIADSVSDAAIRTPSGVTNEVHLRLKPEALGEVTVRVQNVDGKINVHFTAQTAEAQSAIQTGLSELKDRLQSSQFQVAELSVASSEPQLSSFDSKGSVYANQSNPEGGLSFDFNSDSDTRSFDDTQRSDEWGADLQEIRQRTLNSRSAPGALVSAYRDSNRALDVRA